MLASHPHVGILFIGDFSVHLTGWLQSTHIDARGTLYFSISNELEQIIKHPTRVPDHHDQVANSLDDSLPLTLRTIFTLSPLPQDPPTMVLLQFLHPLLSACSYE